MELHKDFSGESGHEWKEFSRFLPTEDIANLTPKGLSSDHTCTSVIQTYPKRHGAQTKTVGSTFLGRCLALGFPFHIYVLYGISEIHPLQQKVLIILIWRRI